MKCTLCHQFVLVAIVACSLAPITLRKSAIKRWSSRISTRLPSPCRMLIQLSSSPAAMKSMRISREQHDVNGVRHGRFATHQRAADVSGDLA